MSTGASGAADATESATAPTLVDGLAVLEEAVNALAYPAVDYRQVLRRAAARLPGDRLEAARTGIVTFLERAPAEAADFRCNAEFMRDRARRELWRLKDVLMNWNPQPVEPQVCHAVPIAIDPARPMPTLDIYGYDFDQVPLELFVMDNQGYFREVTTALTKKNRYHLTVDLGTTGVRFSADSQALVVVWGHLVRYSIPLIQPATPLCPSVIEVIPPGKAIAYAPPLIARASRLDEAKAGVLANAALDYESNKVDATVCVTARGRTAVSGCAVEYVYTSDSDRSIEWVFGELQAGIAHAFDSGHEVSVAGLRRSPVAEWEFKGFAANAPPDAEPRITARLHELRVVSTQPEKCISAIRYLEARRQNAISPGSMRRLDSELRRVDREIMGLRPRFAPPL